MPAGTPGAGLLESASPMQRPLTMATCPCGTLASGSLVMRDAALLADLYEITHGRLVLPRGEARDGDVQPLLAEASAPSIVPDRGGPPGRPGLPPELRVLGGRHPLSAFAFLRELRFTGSVRAVPEGTAIFPDEPLLEVTAPQQRIAAEASATEGVGPREQRAGR